MKLFFGFALVIFISDTAFPQKDKTENVVIVTLDRMCWQEVFGSAGSVLINNMTVRL